MSGNILVHGHMRFADDSDTDNSDTTNKDEDPCKISDHDFFHRFSNKVYANNMHNDMTPVAIASNSAVIYKDMIELFRSLPPQKLTAAALYANVDVYNHLKKEMATALEELTVLGQVCGISLKDIMKEKLKVKLKTNSNNK
jgi:hypothetical protein